MRNKRRRWKLAAQGYQKITNYFSVNNSKSNEVLEISEIFDLNADSSEEETSKYTLSELEQKIKNEIQDLRLQYTAQYLRLVKSGLTRAQASNTISTSLNHGPWTARLIRTWGNQYTKTGTIQASKRGKHQKIWSLLLDEDIKNKLLEYLSFHKFKLSISNLCDYVRNEIFPSVEIETGKTIRWEFKPYQKDIYVDGHERSDVVEYCHSFLDSMMQYELLIPDWSDDLTQQINPVLPAGERLHILVTHDESVFYANDGQRAFGHLLVNNHYVQNQLRQQNNSLPFEQQISTEACCIIHPGNNRDSYWTISDVAQQLKNRAIPIFEAMHSGCVAIFAFDNSSNHAAFANDALVVSRMNFKSGGQQPQMRNTYMRDGTLQEMNYPNSTPKGMYQVLEERGLTYPNLKIICSDCKKRAPQEHDCCATRILSLEPDFANQKSLLEEIVEEAGHKIIFYPKFHCELNYIESYWGAVKVNTHANCDYSFKSLKNIVLMALDSVPLIQIRKYSRHSLRYMSAYRLGLSVKQAAFAVKKYKSYRRIPNNILEDLNIE
ncbi:15974_t:CDS:2 [Cetraspora pellucida]|uniref:15974_t:CDS:1 n=1 Tax=Cetraspora pellucida TaxID=1433469 RepID=A0A9N9DSG6_9GLOM|nr:15974_t:CDS:2 [Cetraspora pellucida]